MVENVPGKRRPLRTLSRHQGGQAAIEFMLVLPFFLGFFLLVVDFGIWMYEFVSVANATREGARYAAVNCGGGGCTWNDITAQTLSRSGGILGAASQVTGGWVDSNVDGKYNRGEPVVVRVKHPYKFLFLNFPTSVVSCIDMRLEQINAKADRVADPAKCP